MKALALILIFIASLFTGCGSNPPAAQQQTKSSGEQVKISYPYQKLSGFASNQMAVWVENEQGSYVKTIYATQWTSKGGYKRRPNSLPEFVKRAQLDKMTQAQVDAFSQATPETGNLTHNWDLTDSNGNKVAQGKYKIFVEGTLRDENSVIYSAEMQIGGQAVSIEARPQYSQTDRTDRNMIGKVTVTYQKS